MAIRDPRLDERTRYGMPTVKPPPAQAFAQLRQTFGAAADGIDNPNGRYSTPARIDPADLRTVPAPDLRAPTPTAPTYKMTRTDGPVSFVPASPPSHTVGEVAFYDTPAKYGVPTSTDRIDYLTQQVDFLREQQAAIAQELRWISEQLQGARHD